MVTVMLHSLKSRLLRRSKPFPNGLERSAVFELLSHQSNPPKVVFLGDSLTAYCEWTELLGQPIANRGIPSDTTAGILARIDQVLALKPSAVFLLAGMNDAEQNVPVHSALENVRQIIGRLQGAGSRIYVQSLLPVRETGEHVQGFLLNGRSKYLNAWAVSMNQMLKGLVNPPSVEYIDLFSAFVEDGQLAPAYSVDGIHLTAEGYALWADILTDKLAESSGPNLLQKQHLRC